MQPTQLYLDTARLGCMSQSAQRAHVDFTRLAGEEGASSFFDRFLREGSQFWSDSERSHYSGLAVWRGVGELKQQLRALAGSNPDLPVLMVNRLAQLMKFAARMLFQRCRNVLITDLGWPPYHEILENECKRSSRQLTCLPLRNVMCGAQASEGEIVENIRKRYLHFNCDGLFVTAVSHSGFRLPVERIVRTLEGVCETRFVVIDGAQDFCHVSADLSNEYCDLYLAGCHKWLQGFHPMGLGFYGRNRSRTMIETLLKDTLARGEFDDPLLRFTTQLETAKLDGETETVNLMPLFTCQGAASDTLTLHETISNRLVQRQKNLAQVASMAQSCGWRAVLPAEPLRTGILLLQAERSKNKNASGRELREAFAGKGVALTGYDGGMIRLSMPGSEWQTQDLNCLSSALHSLA